MPPATSTSSSPGAERLRDIPLADLHPHPANANVMDDAVRATLRRNLDRERICPPLIVRPLPDLPDGYQVLDGHQRLAVLRELGWPTAPCFCWPCDDASALILLATLNRLHGEDVPAQRASLLQELTDHFPLEELATLLPEAADAITQTLTLIDLDPEALLAELVTAAAVAQRQAPRVVSFAVTADEAQLPHQPLDGAAGDRDPLALQLAPHLPRAVDPEVLAVGVAQLHLQGLVAHPPGGGPASSGGVVRRRGNLQLPADRLDPEALAMPPDEAAHFGSRGSSSRAKKAEAALRISLARRSSRFSRSSSRSRSRSSVASPGRAPLSTSARRTHVRNVSAVIPNFEAIDVIVAHCDGCSRSCSNTMRTARSRISAGYLPRRVVAPSSQRLEPPTFPGRFTS